MTQHLTRLLVQQHQQALENRQGAKGGLLDKLSPLALQVLRDVAAGHGTHYKADQSALGGRALALKALRKRGLLNLEGELTAVGGAALQHLQAQQLQAARQSINRIRSLVEQGRIEGE